ncbi:uncharacterized protein LOC110251250 [Exaiptasia diaphana]|uniref:DUF924-domain-containing protein n=1 Tax=Exaiptasia diaphana TaxID=2652724 RepID=A0A913Y268_EXADI|nr:uncharacterized protein LOC110251250 [Exaiptasia diaphana]XP_020913603.1 uncharacterized protein LOC110251250 [Exaiptasia diaphana]
MSGREWGAVLDYWFGGGDPSKRPKWFGGGEAGAQEIREKFGHLVEKARNDELKHWEDDPKATLALIILQDQFCRSLYKGTPKSFDRDPYCNMLAKKFLEQKTHDHLKMSISGRLFIYLPIEHSENIDDQKLSVELFKKLQEDTVGTSEEGAGKGFLDFAEKHLHIVEKFGRFPARNAAIGRENTPEETEWLANPPAGYSF